MPGAFQTTSSVPNVARSLPAVRSFQDGNSPIDPYPSAISGTTKDANGSALPGCAVVLFRTADNSIAAQGVSDAAGAYRLDASVALPHYAVAYLPGSPDVGGTTVNTLVGA